MPCSGFTKPALGNQCPRGSAKSAGSRPNFSRRVVSRPAGSVAAAAGELRQPSKTQSNRQAGEREHDKTESKSRAADMGDLNMGDLSISDDAPASTSWVRARPAARAESRGPPAALRAPHAWQNLRPATRSCVSFHFTAFQPVPPRSARPRPCVHRHAAPMPSVGAPAAETHVVRGMSVRGWLCRLTLLNPRRPLR